MIYLGLDDTDVVDSPGTNQLAKGLAVQILDVCTCHLIVRHQLFFDPRVPYTSKNGSASMWLEPYDEEQLDIRLLIQRITDFVAAHSAEGSDPGVCVARHVPPCITEFGRNCQTQLMTQATARRLASESDLFLVGLGGTQDGVIGSLAAVGLAVTRNDGRAVMIDNRDDIHGVVEIVDLHAQRVIVRQNETNALISDGSIDVGKHLRPNLSQGELVLYARPTESEPQSGHSWEAVRR